MPDCAPHLDENASAVPGLSPGIVVDDECLFREVYKPRDVDANGKVKPAAIPLEDLKHRGWSVHRGWYVSRKAVECAIQVRLQRSQEAQAAEISILKAGDVRQHQDAGKQAFAVIDTAIPDNPAHASIYAVCQGKKSRMRELRYCLLEQLQENMGPIDWAFGEAQESQRRR